MYFYFMARIFSFQLRIQFVHFCNFYMLQNSYRLLPFRLL